MEIHSKHNKDIFIKSNQSKAEFYSILLSATDTSYNTKKSYHKKEKEKMNAALKYVEQ